MKLVLIRHSGRALIPSADLAHDGHHLKAVALQQIAHDLGLSTQTAAKGQADPMVTHPPAQLDGLLHTGPLELSKALDL